MRMHLPQKVRVMLGRSVLSQVEEADIVIVLFSGNSGWAKEAGGIGICHAELLTASASANNRVRPIELRFSLYEVDRSSSRTSYFADSLLPKLSIGRRL